MMYPVVILAGGLATRLRPITDSMPKAMVPVNGKPFIDYQLCYLKKQGIEKVVLCLGYLGYLIEDYVGAGEKYGLNIQYSYDGDQYLGTGGAIIKALNLLGENFFILYGDTFLPINFKLAQDAFESSNLQVLMTVFKNNNQLDKSNVKFITNGLIEYNKNNPGLDMNYIDYGLSLAASKVFENFSAYQPIDLSDIYFNLSHNHEIMGFEVIKPFYEIGTIKGLELTSHFLSELKEIENELL